MKIASIEQIKNVAKHPDADKLDLIQILGFQCVAEKDLYKEGDIICYIQPDTILPEDKEWAAEYKKYAPKRVKTIRLRGKYSEGIIVPLGKLNISGEIGQEISEIIGVKKWKPPLSEDGFSRHGLPFSIPKTDEERWENLEGKIPYGELCDVTLKIDGTSFTACYNLELNQFKIMSRSMEMLDLNKCRFSDIINLYNIQESLTKYCIQNNISLAVRGEVYGSKIQSYKNNPWSKKPKGLAIFSVYSLDTHSYKRKDSRYYFTAVATELKIPHVPILEKDVVLSKELIEKYSIGLEKINEEYFEGVVINTKDTSFKVINKFYDMHK